MSKKDNDEKFVMNFFQKGNGNTQIASVNNFTAKDYMPDDEEESAEDEELTEIEKELDKDKKRLISEKIGKKLTEKGYNSKTVGAFTFYIKTREEYTAALRQTLAFAENMAESAVRDRKKDGDFLQFMSMTVLYLSDLLEKIQTEETEKE